MRNTERIKFGESSEKLAQIYTAKKFERAGECNVPSGLAVQSGMVIVRNANATTSTLCIAVALQQMPELKVLQLSQRVHKTTEYLTKPENL